MLGNLNPFNRPIIIKTVDKLIGYGLDREASALQLEIQPDKSLGIKFKAYGQFIDDLILDAKIAEGVFNKIKHLAGLGPKNTAGSWRADLANQLVKIEASLIKTSRGEIINLELKPITRDFVPLANLALNEEQACLIQNSLEAKGLVLISGPARSGKTAIALTYLQELASPSLNIYTIASDPIIRLPNVNQILIKHHTARHWDEAIAAVAKQDPDIIFLDEPAAGCNAKILGNLASGKIIIITLDAATNWEALKKLGEAKLYQAAAEPKFNLLINQRLSRRLCPHCSFAYQIDERIFQDLNQSFEILDQDLIGLELFHASGCPHCGHTGFMNQINLWEIIKPPVTISRALANGQLAEAENILNQASTLSLIEDGFIKALQGLITVEELKRII